MAYLSKKLSEIDSNIIAVKVPSIKNYKSRINIKGIRRVNKYIDTYLFNNLNLLWIKILQKVYYLYFLLKLRDEDCLFFMEFISNKNIRPFQEELAQKLRERRVKFRLFGLMHLPIQYVINNNLYNNTSTIKKHLTSLDKIAVFGNSLARDIQQMGFKNVITTFHYVDTDYYDLSVKKHCNESLKVIIIGFIMRDFNRIKHIIEACSEITFELCMGRFNYTEQFKHLQNVNLHGLLPENELKNLMQQSDISLNVFDDTVGSNVITTSMACGLAIVVSDVGSIRDYCDSSNAIFCHSNEDYVNAIHFLSDNRTALNKMKCESRTKAEKLSLFKFRDELVTLNASNR